MTTLRQTYLLGRKKGKKNSIQAVVGIPKRQTNERTPECCCSVQCVFLGLPQFRFVILKYSKKLRMYMQFSALKLDL